MLVRSQLSRFTLVLFACTALLGSSAWAANGKHPDGPATTYRGWGPSDLLADGYQCTVFDSLGVRAGAIAFHADGTLGLTLGTESAHFQSTSPGVSETYDLESVAYAFPSIPQQFRSRTGYRIMVFSGRYVAGENLFPIAPLTELAQGISTVEARCVYILDELGNVVFCLNCAFVIS